MAVISNDTAMQLSYIRCGGIQMSINIHFTATREIFVVKTGKTTVQELKIAVWQTPTSDTMKIMNSADPVRAYADWLAGSGDYEVEPVYALGDLDQTTPTGHRRVHYGRQAAAEFLRNVRELTRDGFTVVASAW